MEPLHEPHVLGLMHTALTSLQIIFYIPPADLLRATVTVKFDPQLNSSNSYNGNSHHCAHWVTSSHSSIHFATEKLILSSQIV